MMPALGTAGFVVALAVAAAIGAVIGMGFALFASSRTIRNLNDAYEQSQEQVEALVDELTAAGITFQTTITRPYQEERKLS